MKTYLQLNKDEVTSEIKHLCQSELSYTPQNISEIGETNRLSLAYQVDDKYIVKVVTETHKKIHNGLAEAKNILFKTVFSKPLFVKFNSITEMITHEYTMAEKFSNLHYSPKPIHQTINSTINAGFYITSYINGENFYNYSSTDYSEQIIRDFFSIISNIHKHDLCHGDLQPDNVMVIQDSVKLIDPANINLKSDYKLFDIASALSVAYCLTSEEKCLSIAQDFWSNKTILQTQPILYFLGIQLGYKENIRPLIKHIKNTVN